MLGFRWGENMKSFIPGSHPFVQAANDIRSICHDFLNQQQLNYFACIRFFNEGTFIPLSTTPKFILDWFEAYPLTLSFPKECEHMQRFSYLWDDVLTNNTRQLAQNNHSLFNGLTIIYRYQHHFDTVSFSKAEETTLAGSYYLTSFHLLDQFYKDFCERAEPIQKFVGSQKIYLPEEKQFEHMELIHLHNLDEQIKLQIDHQSKFVTKKEWFCMSLLEEGCSYKQVSSMLEVKAYEVKNCINTVKERMGTQNIGRIVKLVYQTAMQNKTKKRTDLAD